ncbi:unnamed protein product, partial [Ectocarpus sp. 12 AP-2014]
FNTRNPFFSFKDLTYKAAMANANEELSPEYTIITGAWVLDLSRSDAFESYLQCLGAPPEIIRRQASGALERGGRSERTYQEHRRAEKVRNIG